MVNITDLIQRARTIRIETKSKKNTADRIGGLLLDIVNGLGEAQSLKKAQYGGIVATSADVVSDYAAKGYSGPFFYLVGSSLSSLVVYQYAGTGTPAQAFGGAAYDFADYSEALSRVEDLGLKIEQVEEVLGRTLDYSLADYTSAKVWSVSNGVIQKNSSSYTDSAAINEPIHIIAGSNVTFTTKSNGAAYRGYFFNMNGVLVDSWGAYNAVSEVTFVAEQEGLLYLNRSVSSTFSCVVSIRGIKSKVEELEQSLTSQQAQINGLGQSINVKDAATNAKVDTLADKVNAKDYSAQSKTSASIWTVENGKVSYTSSSTYSRYAPISINEGSHIVAKAGPVLTRPLFIITDNDDNVLYAHPFYLTGMNLIAPEKAAKLYISSLPSAYGCVIGSIYGALMQVNEEVLRYSAKESGGSANILLSESMFVDGNIDSTTGGFSSSQSSISTLNYPFSVIPSSTLTYHTENGYRIGVAMYDYNGTIIRKREWFSGDGSLVLESRTRTIKIVITIPSGGSGRATLADSGLTLSVNPSAKNTQAASLEDVEKLEAKFNPLPSTSIVPQQCLVEVTAPIFEFPAISDSVIVSTQSELETALTDLSDKSIILASDIITPRINGVSNNKIIYGNKHKIASYSESFVGNGESNTNTHKLFPYQNRGLLMNRFAPLPYFIDNNYKIHQWKSSIWYEAESQVTKSDGTASSAEYGTFRVKCPSNFIYTTQELVGTYIQFFITWNTLIAKVDSVSDGYIYFTTSAEVTGDTRNPNQEWNANNRLTSFRIINLKDPNSLYFDDSYIYIPRYIESLYLIGILMSATSGVKIKLEDLTIYGSVDNSDNGCSYIIDRCDITYLNRELFPAGIYQYLWLKNSFVKNAMRGVFTGFGTWNVVENCKFEDICEGCSNTSGISCTRDNYIIRNNIIQNYGYNAIRVGNANSTALPSGLVENNLIYQTLEYYRDAIHHVTSDGGAIYIWIVNNNESIGAIVRNNVIHRYNGRGQNRGIMCDDGAGYFYIYGNHVSDTPTSYTIDARYVESQYVLPSGYVSNNAKYIIRNFVDGPIRCAVGLQSNVDESFVQGNVRIYGDKWNIPDELTNNNGLATYEQSIYDNVGYFDADGVAHSSIVYNYNNNGRGN